MFSNQPQNRGLKQQKSHKLLQITIDLTYLKTPSIQVDIFFGKILVNLQKANTTSKTIMQIKKIVGPTIFFYQIT